MRWDRGRLLPAIRFMDLTKALSLSLGQLEEPVVTHYHLGVILWRLYKVRGFGGQPLERLKKDSADSGVFSSRSAAMASAGIITPHPDFKSFAYRVLGRRDEDPAEVACTIDPFCYVSHLSAMSHHGLTDRLPMKLFLSSPTLRDWQVEAGARMGRDLGEDLPAYLEAELPTLVHVRMKKIGFAEVRVIHSKHRGAYKNVKGKTLRVSTLGRTFLDMLRNPELCGGIRHVIEVFREHAATYLRLIVDELEQHGAPIDKVRAGYLLDEQCGLKNGTVESWTKFVQRGGSRKLDASSEYRPVWSDKWCISLNA